MHQYKLMLVSDSEIQQPCASLKPVSWAVPYMKKSPEIPKLTKNWNYHLNDSYEQKEEAV